MHNAQRGVSLLGLIMALFVVIIIALFIGAEARGIMGALLAVPFTVVLQVLFDYFYRFEEEIAATPVEAPVMESPAASASPARKAKV